MAITSLSCSRDWEKPIIFPYNPPIKKKRIEGPDKQISDLLINYFNINSELSFKGVVYNAFLPGEFRCDEMLSDEEKIKCFANWIEDSPPDGVDKLICYMERCNFLMRQDEVKSSFHAKRLFGIDKYIEVFKESFENKEMESFINLITEDENEMGSLSEKQQKFIKAFSGPFRNTLTPEKLKLQLIQILRKHSRCDRIFTHLSDKRKVQWRIFLSLATMHLKMNPPHATLVGKVDDSYKFLGYEKDYLERVCEYFDKLREQRKRVDVKFVIENEKVSASERLQNLMDYCESQNEESVIELLLTIFKEEEGIDSNVSDLLVLFHFRVSSEAKEELSLLLEWYMMIFVRECYGGQDVVKAIYQLMGVNYPFQILSEAREGTGFDRFFQTVTKPGLNFENRLERRLIEALSDKLLSDIGMQQMLGGVTELCDGALGIFLNFVLKNLDVKKKLQWYLFLIVMMDSYLELGKSEKVMIGDFPFLDENEKILIEHINESDICSP